MSDINETLKQRGQRYGVFAENSKIMQDLKDRMRTTPNWGMLESDQKEALDLIAHKIGRILGGDPDYHDNWHDIGGYAKLIADRLEA